MADNELQKQIEELEKTEQELKTKQEELEKIKTTVEDYGNKKSALEKELERITADLTAKREERRQKDLTFQERFEEEQKAKAKKRFFENFGYSDPESQKKVLEVFERIKSGSVDADLIYGDLVKAHLVLNPEKYIQLEQKIKQFSGNVDDFLKNVSSSAFSGLGKETKTEEVELTPEDMEAIRITGIPEMAYRDLKRRGKI
jgi:chromosome segregation ATPase